MDQPINSYTDPVFSQPTKPLPPVNPPRKSFAPTLLIIIVLLLLVATGAYILGVNQGKILVEVEPSPVVSVSPTSGLNSDKTADWKTYTSKYGYLIKYPNTYDIKNTDANNNDALEINEWVENYTTKPTSFYVFTHSKSTTPTINTSSFINEVLPAPQTEKITLLDQKIEKNTYKSGGLTLILLGPIDGGNYYYTIAHFAIQKYPGELEEFDQIVSTFKFIDTSKYGTLSNFGQNYTFVSNQLLDSHESYSITFPNTWEQSIQGEGNQFTLILEKENYKIEIAQNEGEGNQCVFSDTKKSDLIILGSPITDYGEFKTDWALFRYIWEKNDSTEDLSIFWICQKYKSKSSYLLPTDIGYINLMTPYNFDNNRINEIINILETIKLTNN